jgi:hypothetical protein
LEQQWSFWRAVKVNALMHMRASKASSTAAPTFHATNGA